ncbi:hypothetical protein MAUB1S_11644 [Mycolicibacterium aubagnense]
MTMSQTTPRRSSLIPAPSLRSPRLPLNPSACCRCRRARRRGSRRWRSGTATGWKPTPTPPSPTSASPPARDVRTSSTARRWSPTASTTPRTCWKTWWRTSCGRACSRASAPTRRPPRGSSPARAASTRAWPANCSSPNRFSPTSCAAAHRRWIRFCRVPCLRSCSAVTGKRQRRCATPHSRSPRSSRSRWVWRGCGSHGGSNRMRCWATASVSTRRPAWPVCSAWKTAPA